MNLQEKISHALERTLKKAKPKGSNIVHSNEISRADRELLLKTHWLEPIISGWYIIVQPHVRVGESSVWYANFWNFVSLYLKSHFDKDYCLSAENSIDIHTESPTIPNQVIAIVSNGGGAIVNLPFRTSIFPYRDPTNLPKERIEKNHIQIMELGFALCKVSPTYFEKEQQKAEIALRLIRSPDELLTPIFNHGFQAAAARLVGAYQFFDDQTMANSLISSLEKFGLSIKPQNPFQSTKPLTLTRERSPYIARIFSMWNDYRGVIIDTFPEAKISKQTPEQQLSNIEDIYKQDAYNSLSIEGYHVDDELIEKVRNNHWNPNLYKEDHETKDALAARGYYEAFKEVKQSILKMLTDGHPAQILENDLSKWFQSLFAPSVRAGIIKATDLFGYRKYPVYIRNSRHIPLPKEGLLDAMEAFFTCLKNEPHPAVRAILGHFIFVYIHPYMDGNGRIGRFLMNAMLVSGGYPWTIVRLKNREEYLFSLEKASVDRDILPFTNFILHELQAH